MTRHVYQATVEHDSRDFNQILLNDKDEQVLVGSKVCYLWLRCFDDCEDDDADDDDADVSGKNDRLVGYLNIRGSA